MKVGNWNLIEEAGSFVKLPVGGYVLRIVDVKDNSNGEYLEIVYDIAEGPFAGHYAADDDWRHTFRKYYGGKAAGFFKAFLNRLEESNRGRFTVDRWTINCNEREFIGLEIGGLIQERYYTNQQGEDKTVLEVADTVAAQDIRNGDYKLPAPRDMREKISPAVSSFTPTFDTADVPF